MRRLTLCSLLFVSGLVAAQSDEADPAKGERLFLDIGCYSCHGYNGTGRVPLSTETSGLLGSETAFLAYMRLRGEKAQLYPSREMPHYGTEVISDGELLDLYAYLVSLDDDPPALEDIPVLQDLIDDAKADKRDDTTNPE